MSVTSRASFVRETSATTGTGPYELAGAVTGPPQDYQTFVAGNGDGEVVCYAATDGTDWEVCEGTITDASPDTLSRDTVLESSNGGLAVDWGAGTKIISQVFTPGEADSIAALNVEDSETITVKKSVPVTLSGGEFDIDLTDYQDGDRLVIEGQITGAATTTYEAVNVWVNGDTTDTNYHRQGLEGYNGSASAPESNTNALLPITAVSGEYANVRIVVENYAAASIRKYLEGSSITSYTASELHSIRSMVRTSITDPVTSITIAPINTAALSGTLHAYIEKEGVLPTTGYTQSIVLDIGDETTALTTGTAKKTFRMPYAFTLTDVRASVTTAPTGDSIEVDINEAGVSILSTVLSIDATEKTSTTAATPAVISDTELADDAEITIDIDQIGSSTAGAGLKVMLIGHRD